MVQRPILMNEEGGSPGGGAPAPAPVATPAEPQAQGEAPVTMSALKGLLSGFKTELESGIKNGIHADLRRAGIYDKANPSPTAPAPKPVAAELPGVAQSGGMTAGEVQQLLARERAFERTVAPAALNDRQRARMDESYQAVNPSDPAEWARGYLADMGIGNKTAPPSTITPTINTAPALGQPIPAVTPPRATPDLGAPAPGDQRDSEAVLLNRPLDMNGHDFDRLSAQHGREKALQMVNANVNTYLRGVKLVSPSRRQR